MPHRRRKKKEAETRLIFDSASSILYLSATSLSEDTVTVPLDTLLVLSVVKYAGAEQQFHVCLVEEQCEDDRLAVVVRRESFGFSSLTEKPVPQPVANCRLVFLGNGFFKEFKLLFAKKNQNFK